MDTQLVKINQINTSNIIFGTPVEKPIPNTNQKYSEISIDYNFGTVDKPFLGPFYVELPEVTSTTGITETEPVPGKIKNSIQISLPLNSDSDVTQMILNGMSEIYKAAAKNIFSNKGVLRLPHFNKDNPEASNFRHPIYYPRDKVSSEVIPGKSPNMYVPLFDRGYYKSQFFDLRENFINWKLLKNVDMKFVPVIQIEKIYIGANKPSLQYKMISAVVTSVVSKNSKILQRETIETLKNKNPSLVNLVDSQLSLLQNMNSSSVSDVMEPVLSSSPVKDLNISDLPPAHAPTPSMTNVKPPSKSSIPRVSVNNTSNIDSFLKS
jgi:hypothetical protein